MNRGDKRKSGVGAMKGWRTRRKLALSHADLCRLSRAFNEIANLGLTQDYRINEWLKRKIASAERRAVLE